MASFFDRILGIKNTNTNGAWSTNVIDDYRANVDGLARSYLFKVWVNFNKVFNANDVDSQEYKNIPFLVKSTTLPDTTMEEISTYFMGQQYKMSSVRRFTDWTVTYYIDNKANLLSNFYEWSQFCHSKENRYGEPKKYMTDVTVSLLNPENPGLETMTYKLIKAWPKSISNVSLDYSNNEFLTADIIFSYQRHEVAYNTGVAGSVDDGMGNEAINWCHSEMTPTRNIPGYTMPAGTDY